MHLQKALGRIKPGLALVKIERVVARLLEHNRLTQLPSFDGDTRFLGMAAGEAARVSDASAHIEPLSQTFQLTLALLIAREGFG